MRVSPLVYTFDLDKVLHIFEEEEQVWGRDGRKREYDIKDYLHTKPGRN